VKVVLAPDKFKGSLLATDVCDAMETGIMRAFPATVVRKVPMADGGEGTVEAVIGATQGQRVAVSVTGPLGDLVEAFYGILGDGKTAVMEMAAAAGLPLVPANRRNPLATTTYGVGEMIADAVRRGCTRVVLGIGGSATNDGGAGMAQALGISLRDAGGNELRRGGAALRSLATIDMQGFVLAGRSLEVVTACDVDNPIYGPRGASAIYGPQKGASPEMVALLDDALRHFGDVTKVQLGKDVAQVPGSGAAGGLGGGLMAFLGARLQSGVDLIMETVGLESQIEGADLVFTGEGKLDEQTLMGKVPQGVARVAREHGVPVIAIAGACLVSPGDLAAAGIGAAFGALTRPQTLAEAMATAKENVAVVSENAFRLFMMGRRGIETN
jgi:glycerate 2-kinase